MDPIEINEGCKKGKLEHCSIIEEVEDTLPRKLISILSHTKNSAKSYLIKMGKYEINFEQYPIN